MKWIKSNHRDTPTDIDLIMDGCDDNNHCAFVRPAPMAINYKPDWVETRNHGWYATVEHGDSQLGDVWYPTLEEAQRYCEVEMVKYRLEGGEV